MRLIVLATYYFLKEGVKTPYDFTTPKAYEAILLGICEGFRRVDEGSVLPQIRLSHIVKLPVRVPVGFPYNDAENHETEPRANSNNGNEIVALSDEVEEEEPADALASRVWPPTVWHHTD